MGCLHINNLYINIYCICELERNWVEPMSLSLEKIVEVMRNWFVPEKIGFNLIATQLVT